MKTKLKMISKMAAMAFGLGAALSSINTANAGVDVKVDLTTQRMHVSVDGSHYATWKVSTARRGYVTPTGHYRVQRMERMHYSRKYHNSPMPFSVFFRGGFAIHGTGAISRLGRVASHGCVRLHPSNAGELYSLIRQNGVRSTKIRIVRSPRTFSVKKRSKPRSWSTASNFQKKRKNTRLNVKLRKTRVASNSGRKFFIFGGLDLAD